MYVDWKVTASIDFYQQRSTDTLMTYFDKLISIMAIKIEKAMTSWGLIKLKDSC